VEFGYSKDDQWPALGSWIIEGSARAMEDKIFIDIDQEPDWSFYVGEINKYLGAPNGPLFSASYRAALFWTYGMEQLGAPAAEPYHGVEFMLALWQVLDIY
jgi:hypothetical protein